MKVSSLFLKVILLFSFMFLYALQGMAQPDADRPKLTKDQVILDDLIVSSSLCVGFDCVNGESFGFDTIRLKENNLRIKFQDTSTGSFPSRDWQITINDSASGGQNKFSIEDIDGARIPFTILAGAPSHSLFVDASGRIGIGTSTPVLNIHTKTGNTPTLRLEQDGSSGFTAQTWDIAGNEANFFVRDVTGGSRLPFRIIPNANTNSLVIDAQGEVAIGGGAGTNAEADLHIKRTDNNNGTLLRVENTNSTLNPTAVPFVVKDDGKVGIGTDAPDALLVVKKDNNGDTRFDVSNLFNGSSARAIFGMNAYQSSSVFLQTPQNFTTIPSWSDRLIVGTNSETSKGLLLRAANGGVQITADASLNNPNFVVAASGGVGIGTSTPAVGSALDVNGAIYQSGGVIHASDKRLKSKISKFDKGLKEVLQLNPIIYKFNGKAGITYDKMQIGLVAQELQEVAPEMVQEFNYAQTDENEKVISEETYLSIRESEIPYLLINAIKDQNEVVNSQKEEIEFLKLENIKLNKIVAELAEKVNSIYTENVNIENSKTFLSQNVPNPFGSETKISYFIPENSRNAAIQFTNISGQVLKTIAINNTGNGVLNLNANELNQGTYSYSLIIDGKIIATQKMVIAK